jgi:AraC-like DNA-binding protein
MHNPEPDPIPLVRAAVVRPVLAVLAGFGCRVDRLLAELELPGQTITNPERLIPLHQGVRFLEEAARSQGIAQLGLLAGLATSIDALGMFGMLIQQSRSLDEALSLLFTLGPKFNSGERWWLALEGDRARLCHRYFHRFDDGGRQAEQFCVASAVTIVRLVGGPAWTPEEVWFESRRFPVTVLPGTRLHFEQPTTAIVFPSILLSARLAPRIPATTPRDLLDEWIASAPARDFTGSLQQAITALSPPRGHLRIGMTASALGLSVRTFQRRLADAGLSFESVLRMSRLDVAARLLAETSSRVLDIALDLGYSDHAHFTRAFRRWTGLAPLEYRRAHQARLDEVWSRHAS